MRVDDINFETDVERSTLPVLVTFGAAWCKPCKALNKTLDGMVHEYRDRVRFVHVDIQHATVAGQKYDVRTVPTLIVFKDGVPAGSLVGNQPRGKIEDLLSVVLAR